jgi:glycosyltransferase involved in cell wall biosynthesis
LRDIPILAYTLLGGRVVAHCHGSDLENLLNDRWYSPIARVLYARCEVIFPCKYLAQRLERLVPQAHVCENFLADAPQILPAANSVRHAGPLTVLWNSNVMASKGYLDVAEAVKRSVDEGHAIRFLSFGAILSDSEMPDGELASELARYSRYNWFEHLGKVPHKVAVSHLQDCDVVALPSRYHSEMQPLAIIEAMSTGRRVIISDRPSLRVTIGDYPAAIVDPTRPQDISGILVEMCKQKADDPIGFANANLEPAKQARIRYSVERFRASMSSILFRGRRHMD